MDTDSSTKFIGSLTKFLQSLCNGYVEFEDGVELIGHIYLSVDTNKKKGKKIDYILNEKVCKSDNAVTFISNSFHALPEKAKGSGKDEERTEEVFDPGDGVPRSTNSGTMISRVAAGSRSAPSPGQNRSGVQAGSKRPGSPLKGPTPSQRRATSPPSQRRPQQTSAKPPSGSPASRNVPSSPSSSSQDNIPSPSARKNRTESSQPPSNQSDHANAENETDGISNILSINPTPEFASFLGSLTGDNQTTRDESSPQRDTKPEPDVTFIKEEYMSEPSSCAQAGNSGQHSGRPGEDDGSGLYPVMMHQNTSSVFPGTSGYQGYPSGASSTATSQQPAFPGPSTSQSDIFSPGSSQDGADPSGKSEGTSMEMSAFVRKSPGKGYQCLVCGKCFSQTSTWHRHFRIHTKHVMFFCSVCGKRFNRNDNLIRHTRYAHRERV